jgi:hypothetical protein
MIHYIIAKFEYRPIGQGLFFTGKFKHVSSRKSFTMVYDCGHSTYSTNASYIDAEIDEFASEIEDKIDMLVISHFHADHVNTRTRKFLPEGPLLVQGYFVVFTKVPDGPNEVTDEGKWGKWQPGWLPSTEDVLATDWLT